MYTLPPMLPMSIQQRQSDRAGVESSLRAGFQSGIQYDIEFRLRSKEGLYRWFLSQGRPLYQTPGGPVKQWLRTTTNIDDRKRDEERLEVAVKERTVELDALERAQCAVQTKHSAPTLDLPGLLGRLMGDELLAVEVMDGFAQDMPAQVQSLVHSASAGSIAEVASLAHQIRGAAATIGGEALRAVAAEIELAARAGNLAAAKACMANLEKQFLLLMEAIAGHHPISH